MGKSFLLLFFKKEDLPVFPAPRSPVQPNSHDPTAWRQLGDARRLAGDEAGADEAYVAYAGCAAGDPELLHAARSLRAGQTKDAESILRARVRATPNDVVALRMLAESRMMQGDHGETEACLQQTLALAPSYEQARHHYAMVLFRQGKLAEAIDNLQILLRQKGENPAYRNLLATAFVLANQFEPAIELYEAMLQAMPGQAKLWLSYGAALRCAGRRDDSLRAIRTCLRLAPATGRAYWDLANLKTEILTQDDTEAMRGLLAAPDISAEDRTYLHFALGHAQAQRGDYEDSFAHYAAGAALKRAAIDYDPDAFHAQVRAATELFTPAFFAARQGAGLPDPAPIFIVGLPRTGSTLVEQILSSHSAVEGTTELSAIGNIVRDLSRQANDQEYPQCLAALEPAELAALGRRYIDRTRIYRKTERPFFIDKMPANWEHVGLIHLILPQAKIIDMRRDPMASCFAAFRQYFDAGATFSYDLAELGRYYNDYAEWMAHLHRVLPGRVHRVTYETLVTDTEAEIRRLLVYCGLPFEPACLRFWETRRQVATASSEQVRQPIFRAGLDEWRHYEPWLGPLKERLLF